MRALPLKRDTCGDSHQKDKANPAKIDHVNSFSHRLQLGCILQKEAQ